MKIATITIHTHAATSWIWPAVGFAMTLAVLHGVQDWNGRQSDARRSITGSSRARKLAGDDMRKIVVGNDSIYDDADRDEICRKYIWNFLNGTTDLSDQCEVFYEAYKAADCKESNRQLSRTGSNASTHDNNDTNSWECCASVSDFYATNCQDTGLDAVRLLIIVSVLIICGLLRSVVRMMGVPWVPNAGVCVIVGAIAGGIMRLVSADIVKDRFVFDNDLFLQILLPPIIFQAAICIDKRAFRRDLFPILSFAVIGTGLSAVIIGLFTFHMSHWMVGHSLPLLDSLLFGALMSSIDPVATLSILASVGVCQTDTLYTLIFGESLLNDGVSIVLFDSLVRHMGDKGVVDAATVHDTLWDFVLVTSGSISVGAFCGALCTLYFWLSQGKQSAVAEVGLFFMWALVPYYVADGLGLSGITSIMVMGFMMDYFVVGGFQNEDGEWMDYIQLHSSDEAAPLEPAFERFRAAMGKAFSGRGHIHSKSRRHVGFVAEVIASLMETAIFAYLGLFLFNEQTWDLALMSTGIMACVISRAGMVICLSTAVNMCVWLDLEGLLGRLCRFFKEGNASRRPIDAGNNERKAYLDKRTQLILFSAGVRGAVSYALVQNIPMYNSVTKHGSHFKGELKAMTSATIVVLLFTFGAMTYYTVQRDWTQEHEHRSGPSQERLLTRQRSTTLASDDGFVDNENEMDIDRRSLEIDRSRASTHFMTGGGTLS